MARLPRFTMHGQPQHVIQRGNNREPIFADVEDYQYYLERLREVARKCQVDIHSYVLMTNPVHLFGYTLERCENRGDDAIPRSVL